jgi:hypothetical protein
MGTRPVSPHIYTPVKQEVMAYHLSVPNHSGELKNIKYEWEDTSVRFLIRIHRGANCGTRFRDKYLFLKNSPIIVLKLKV